MVDLSTYVSSPCMTLHSISDNISLLTQLIKTLILVEKLDEVS
jgi:hypothetical protein